MTTLEKTLATLSLIFALGAGFFLALNLTQPQVAGSFNPTGGGTYLLNSSISSSQTSITLTSFTEPGSGIPYTMSYINTDIIYGTISPSSGNSEFISATGITQNGNGTATLTGVRRGESRTPGTGGCVASTTLAHAYPGQTQLILSNSPCFYSEFAMRRSPQNITAPWNFDQYPTASTTLGNATTSRQFITLGQAQGLANQGAATATESVTGITRLATALQTASSTFLGVNDPLANQPRYATDTPQSGCAVGYTGIAGASCTVVAQLTGKIRQTWINLMEAWTFAGGLTSSALTTIAASNNSSLALVLNGLPYKFPGTRQASSTVLAEDGSGNLSWMVPTKLASSTANFADIVNSSASTTLVSINIPANQLGTNGAVRITIPFTGLNVVTGDNFWIDFAYGTATSTSKISNGTGGTVVTDGMLSFTLVANASTNSQSLNTNLVSATEGFNATPKGGFWDMNTASTQDSTTPLQLLVVVRSENNGGIFAFRPSSILVTYLR